MATDYKPLSAWNYLVGLATRIGFGLPAGAATVVNPVAQATLEFFFDGSTTAGVTKTLDLTANYQQHSVRKQAGFGKDIAARIHFYTVERKEFIGNSQGCVELDIDLHSPQRHMV